MTLTACKKACEDEPACVAFSSSTDHGQWCVGCKVELDAPHAGAIAFKKCTDAPTTSGLYAADYLRSVLQYDLRSVLQYDLRSDHGRSDHHRSGLLRVCVDQHLLKRRKHCGRSRRRRGREGRAGQGT